MGGNPIEAGIFLGIPREITVSSQKLVLNLSEAAELLGIKPSQLYEHTRSRARARQRIPIPHLRLGKRIAFRRESLEKWLAQLEEITRVRS
jgi:predicted DNA-binding transcriptional regulator AlpA